MPQSKTLSMLGLCRRAGRLSMGHDMAVQAVVKGKAQLLLFCSDASPRLVSEFETLLQKHRSAIPLLVIKPTMEEIHIALGYRAGVMSVDDENFSDRINALIRQEELRYGSED